MRSEPHDFPVELRDASTNALESATTSHALLASNLEDDDVRDAVEALEKNPTTSVLVGFSRISRPIAHAIALSFAQSLRDEDLFR